MPESGQLDRAIIKTACAMCLHKEHVDIIEDTITLTQGYTIFVVDDHPLMRQGFRLLIENDPGLVYGGEASDGAEAIGKLLNAGPPDLVVTDISMKGMNGLELTRRLHGMWPGLPILVSSTYEKQEYAKAAFEAGARGYIEKCALIDHAIDAIRCLLDVSPCKHCKYLLNDHYKSVIGPP